MLNTVNDCHGAISVKPSASIPRIAPPTVITPREPVGTVLIGQKASRRSREIPRRRASRTMGNAFGSDLSSRYLDMVLFREFRRCVRRWGRLRGRPRAPVQLEF